VLPARAARLMFQLPRQGRLYVKLDGSNQWTWQEVLLNKLIYNVEILAWQNTKDATKKPPQNAPKLFVPEFMESIYGARAVSKEAAAQDVDDIKNILSRPRKAA
jgi:hypothetical protein